MLMANSYDIQLSTVVENKELTPVIKLNGHIVISIRDVAPNQTYSSKFERAEKIFATLNSVSKTSSNLSRIRIRRSQNKVDYIAYSDNIELYRVTPSDVVGETISVYQMAIRWRSSIREALKVPPIAAESSEEDTPPITWGDNPIVGFLSLFSNNSVFIMIMQFVLFVLIQIIAIILTFKYVNQQQKKTNEDRQKRIKQLDQYQIQQKNLLASIEHRMQQFEKKYLQQNREV